jgi:mannose/fructose/N-acetylgalactosamine-specific phosphotransferase system component IID
MDAVLRYVVATLVAVAAGWIGYYFVPIEPFGIVGNTLFIGALFGLFMGFVRITGFLGNIINAFLLSFPLWYILPGEWYVIWTCGNVGYALGNVLGQLTTLSIENKIEAKAL